MHPSGIKSSARHLASGGCASDMKKSHADTVTVQTWDLMLFQPGRAAGTDPDGSFLVGRFGNKKFQLGIDKKIGRGVIWKKVVC